MRGRFGGPPGPTRAVVRVLVPERCRAPGHVAGSWPEAGAARSQVWGRRGARSPGPTWASVRASVPQQGRRPRRGALKLGAAGVLADPVQSSLARRPPGWRTTRPSSSSNRSSGATQAAERARSRMSWSSAIGLGPSRSRMASVSPPGPTGSLLGAVLPAMALLSPAAAAVGDARAAARPSVAPAGAAGGSAGGAVATARGAAAPVEVALAPAAGLLVPARAAVGASAAAVAPAEGGCSPAEVVVCPLGGRSASSAANRGDRRASPVRGPSGDGGRPEREGGGSSTGAVRGWSGAQAPQRALDWSVAKRAVRAGSGAGPSKASGGSVRVGGGWRERAWAGGVPALVGVPGRVCAPNRPASAVVMSAVPRTRVAPSRIRALQPLARASNGWPGTAMTSRP